MWCKGTHLRKRHFVSRSYRYVCGCGGLLLHKALAVCLQGSLTTPASACLHLSTSVFLI